MPISLSVGLTLDLVDGELTYRCCLSLVEEPEARVAAARPVFARSAWVAALSHPGQ